MSRLAQNSPYLLAYKAFKSTEDFEAWQAENPDLEVCTIQPFLGSADFDFKEQAQEAYIETHVTVFVVYRKPKPKLEPEDIL
jgi:hypothetical protein